MVAILCRRNKILHSISVTIFISQLTRTVRLKYLKKKLSCSSNDDVFISVLISSNVDGLLEVGEVNSFIQGDVNECCPLIGSNTEHSKESIKVSFNYVSFKLSFRGSI